MQFTTLFLLFYFITIIIAKNLGKFNFIIYLFGSTCIIIWNSCTDKLNGVGSIFLLTFSRFPRSSLLNFLWSQCRSSRDPLVFFPAFFRENQYHDLSDFQLNILIHASSRVQYNLSIKSRKRSYNYIGFEYADDH